MQITTCKKSTKSLKPFQRYWRFVISEKFGHTGQINEMIQRFPDILPLCPDMPDQAQQILHFVDI